MTSRGYTNADIMRELGAMAEGLKGIRRDTDALVESNKSIVATISEQGKAIIDLNYKLEAQSTVQKQQQEAIVGLNAQIEPLARLKDDLPQMVEAWRSIQDDLPKMVEGWKDLRKTSQRLVWLLSIGGVSILSGFVWFGNIILEWIRHILRIPPI